MRERWLAIVGLFLCLGLSAIVPNAPAQTHPDLPRWEVGAGVGYIRFEQYPASNEYTHWTVPFPTFTYRGDILRADDRRGAKLYLLRKESWLIQVGGFGTPPLESHRNQARRNMEDLPLLAGAGPEFQKTLTDTLTAKIGIYPAMTFTLEKTEPRGAEWEVDITYRHRFQLNPERSLGFRKSSTFLSWMIVGASQEVQDLYFSVRPSEATSERPTFHAEAGLFRTHLTFLQSFYNDHFGVYIGGRLADYRFNPNTDSPLYKSDTNLSVLVGMTYSFYQSRREGKTDEDASGAVKKIREELEKRR